MKRLARHVAVIIGWALFAAVCQAQAFGQAPYRPGLSPYLNLNRGGNPAINYYGLVRPQIAAQQAFQTIGSNIVTLENSLNLPSQTGIRSSFMTHNRYFMNNGSGGVNKTATAAPPTATPRSAHSPTGR